MVRRFTPRNPSQPAMNPTAASPPGPPASRHWPPAFAGISSVTATSPSPTSAFAATSATAEPASVCGRLNRPHFVHDRHSFWLRPEMPEADALRGLRRGKDAARGGSPWSEPAAVHPLWGGANSDVGVVPAQPATNTASDPAAPDRLRPHRQARWLPRPGSRTDARKWAGRVGWAVDGMARTPTLGGRVRREGDVSGGVRPQRLARQPGCVGEGPIPRRSEDGHPPPARPRPHPHP
jgi:hypothetical protein